MWSYTSFYRDPKILMLFSFGPQLNPMFHYVPIVLTTSAHHSFLRSPLNITHFCSPDLIPFINLIDTWRLLISFIPLVLFLPYIPCLLVHRTLIISNNYHPSILHDMWMSHLSPNRLSGYILATSCPLLFDIFS